MHIGKQRRTDKPAVPGAFWPPFPARQQWDLDPGTRSALEQAHRRPVRRGGAGRALASAGATAMIDVSDGLATDAAHLASASGVAMTLELDALPLAQGVREPDGQAARLALIAQWSDAV